MSGQRIHGALSAMVIIEMPDGSRYGWEILDPERLEWEMLRVDDEWGTIARMTVEGPFLRKQPSALPDIAGAFIDGINTLAARALPRGEPDGDPNAEVR